MGLMDSIKKHVIEEGVGGKVIMAYGDNNTGKTFQFSQNSNNLFLVFEPSAINALAKADYIECFTFAKFKKFSDDTFKSKQKNEKIKFRLAESKQKVEFYAEKLKDVKGVSDDDIKQLKIKLTMAKKNVDKYEVKMKEDDYYLFTQQYNSLTLDSLTSFSMLAKRFVMDRNDAVVLADGEWGSLFKELENEFFMPYHQLLSLNLTLFITAHRKQVKIGGTQTNPVYQYYPLGEKKVVKTIIDSCDIVVYLNKEYNEAGNEIDSSAHFRMTTEFFARNKWRGNMVDFIHPYTLEGMNEAINNAINGVSTEAGVTPVTKEKVNENINDSIIDNTDELKYKLQRLGEIFYVGEGDGDLDEDEPSEIFWMFDEANVEILHDKLISQCTFKQQSHLQRLYEMVLPIALENKLIKDEEELMEGFDF